MRSTSISSDVKLLFAAFLILVFTRADGQSNSILNFKVGSIIHREQYNGNGKLESRTIETILRCDTTAEGLLYVVNIVKHSAAGEELSNGEGTIRCVNGDILIDMKSIYSMLDNKAYRWETESEDLIIPGAMRDGDVLPDAKVVCIVIKEPRVKVRPAGSSLKSDMGARVIYAVNNRRVTNDTITTFLGKVQALKVTSDVVNESEVGVGYSVRLVTEEWYVPGVGLVRLEVKKERGKLVSSTVMTKRVE